MLTLLIACTPLLCMWVAAQSLAWLRLPVRRGALLQRWRDLREPRGREAGESRLIDLSRRSAAYLVALRVGAVVRGASYALLFACGFSGIGFLLGLLGLAVVIWLYNHWLQIANFSFSALTGDPHTGLTDSAQAYRFPSHRRGLLWNFTESLPAYIPSVLGLGLVSASGLSLAWKSDTLPSGIPGLYVQHTHLPHWATTLVIFAFGLTLAAAGTWIERATRRRAMRRETVIPEAHSKRPRMVFLRPFGTEELSVSTHPGPRRDGLQLLLPRHSDFLEDVATWLLWSRGEVVAIAQPAKARTKTVGAAHHPIRETGDWQAAVSSLMGSAAGILLVPGVTPGVAWEHDQVRLDPALAAKTLFLNPRPRRGADPFLEILGASAAQKLELGERRLMAVAAVLDENGPKLLCSSLNEDVDVEVAVDWFLQKELPPSNGSSLIRALKSWLKEALSPAG